MPSVALHLVRWLQQAGVKRIFSLSGNQVLSIYDACLELGMEIIHVRHEAAAVHMADAWGRLTGQPGVALLTAGPGHANGLSAAYVAREAESPLILLSGACPASSAASGGFQAMPQTELAAGVCKAATTLERPEDVISTLKWASRTASIDRPGPVAITLPGDILEADLQRPLATDQEAHDDYCPPGQDLAQKEECYYERMPVWRSAKRPLILFGPASCRGTDHKILPMFEQMAGAPCIAMESPRGVNDPSLGLLGEVLGRADVVALMDKRLDWSLRFGQSPPFAPDCRFLPFYSDDEAFQQAMTNAPDKIAGDLRGKGYLLKVLLMEAAASALARSMEPAWPAEVAAALAWRPPAWSLDRSAKTTEPGPIHPLDVALAIKPWLRDNDIFISDGGEFGQWAQAVLSTEQRLINGPSGSIGGSLPFALAARLADRKARVVVTLGDGTFGFHAMEFDTAVRYGLPFVAVVGNDARWNAESQLQANIYGLDRQYACDLLPTRYDQIVAALGGHGEYVTQLSELPDALKRAFDSNLPACVNVMIEPAAAPTFKRT